MEFLTALLKSMPGAVGQGLIWGIMAIGVYITYRILDVADLTVDGSLATGGGRLRTAGPQRRQHLDRHPVRHSGRDAGGTGHRPAPHRLRDSGDPGRYFNPAGAVVHQPGHYGYEGQCGHQRH